MIVKNETHVIKRSLDSVKSLIDYWVIVDTGSTDGTQALIKELMKDIPGELHERPWKNFGHNRNEAFELAKGKGDYILFLDADDSIKISPDFKKPTFIHDSYFCNVCHANLVHDRTIMVKDGMEWKWMGVLHEYLHSPLSKNKGKIEGLTLIATTEGSRSKDPLKYQKDAQILEEALKEEPNNSRYVYYLAQSYKDAGDYSSALKNYEKRISMGGWNEEVFSAMLSVGHMHQLLQSPDALILKSYYEAYHYRPTRAEPLYYLSRFYRDKNDFASGFLIAEIGLTIPLPKDVLFIEKNIYDYEMLLEASVNAYWIGKYDTCQGYCKKILALENIPPEIRTLVESNLTFANMKLAEKEEVKGK